MQTRSQSKGKVNSSPIRKFRKKSPKKSISSQKMSSPGPYNQGNPEDQATNAASEATVTPSVSEILEDIRQRLSNLEQNARQIITQRPQNETPVPRGLISDNDDDNIEEDDHSSHISYPSALGVASVRPTAESQQNIMIQNINVEKLTELTYT